MVSNLKIVCDDVVGVTIISSTVIAILKLRHARTMYVDTFGALCGVYINQL